MNPTTYRVVDCAILLLCVAVPLVVWHRLWRMGVSCDKLVSRTCTAISGAVFALGAGGVARWVLPAAGFITYRAATACVICTALYYLLRLSVFVPRWVKRERENARLHRILLAEQRKMQAFFDYTPQAVAMHVGVEMLVIMVSKAWLRGFGMTRLDAIGRSTYQIFPKMRSDWREQHSRVLQGETVEVHDDYFWHDDGRLQYVRRKLAPWRDGDGRVAGVITWTEFISEERHSLLAQEARLLQRLEQVEGAEHGR